MPKHMNGQSWVLDPEPIYSAVTLQAASAKGGLWALLLPKQIGSVPPEQIEALQVKDVRSEQLIQIRYSSSSMVSKIISTADKKTIETRQEYARTQSNHWDTANTATKDKPTQLGLQCHNSNVIICPNRTNKKVKTIQGPNGYTKTTPWPTQLGLKWYVTCPNSNEKITLSKNNDWPCGHKFKWCQYLSKTATSKEALTPLKKLSKLIPVAKANTKNHDWKGWDAPCKNETNRSTR